MSSTERIRSGPQPECRTTELNALGYPTGLIPDRSNPVKISTFSGPPRSAGPHAALTTLPLRPTHPPPPCVRVRHPVVHPLSPCNQQAPRTPPSLLAPRRRRATSRECVHVPSCLLLNAFPLFPSLVHFLTPYVCCRPFSPFSYALLAGELPS